MDEARRQEGRIKQLAFSAGLDVEGVPAGELQAELNTVLDELSRLDRQGKLVIIQAYKDLRAILRGEAPGEIADGRGVGREAVMGGAIRFARLIGARGIVGAMGNGTLTPEMVDGYLPTGRAQRSGVPRLKRANSGNGGDSQKLVPPSGDMSWQDDALCARTDPEAFFPEKGGSTREAKEVCKGCGVRNECLVYALDNDERFGVWGGLSERERRKLKRRG